MHFAENTYLTDTVMAFENLLIPMVLKNIPLEC